MIDFTPPKRSPIRFLTIGYVAALTIIAAMSICIHVFLDQVIAEQNNSSAVVAARQAKLSQRIALHASDYIADPTTILRQQIEDEIDLMGYSHAGLLSGSSSLNLPPDKPADIQKIYEDLPYRLDYHVRTFLDEARAFLEVPPGQLKESNAHYQYIVGASQGPLSAALDAAVTAYENDSVEKIAHLQSYQRMALFVIFATLVAEAFLIFMPLVRRVEEYASKLEMLASTDPLTGIDNYRSFMQKGLKEIRRSVRLSKPLCVCVLDLDFFKDINDKYGHGVGDTVLREFSITVQKCLRVEDEVGRVGGEEFGLLLPHTRLSDAQTVAERIRRIIEITPIRIQDEKDIGAMQLNAYPQDVVFNVSAGTGPICKACSISR
ncbi:MAG: GGDEF domain-containing protein [Alphaproteobacteria bacterium]|nr:GGDEF domain-containing protein [Alphaproteobacteria bacterium]